MKIKIFSGLIDDNLEEKIGGINMTKGTLTVEEVAKYIGIGMNKAYDLVKLQGFPVIRIGRRFIIPKSALDEWLLKNAKSN